MDIPVSKFYSITKANGVDVVHFSNNDFRYFLSNSFYKLKYCPIGSSIYTLVDCDYSVEEKRVYDSLKIPLVDFAQVILALVRDEFHSEELTIAEAIEEDSYDHLDYSNYTYPSEVYVPFLEKRIAASAAESINTIQKAKEEIAAHIASNKVMFDDFISLIKYVLTCYKEVVDDLILRFEADAPVTFYEICTILKEYSGSYLIDIGDANIISKIFKPDVSNTMAGQVLRYFYNSYYFNSKAYNRSDVHGRISEFKGRIPLSKFGIKSYTDDDVAAIKERSKIVFDLNVVPAYKYYTGTMSSSYGWFKQEFAATGRCMVDIKTLMNINPNFGDYYPYGLRDSLRDSVESVLSYDSIPEEMLLCMTPYVYAFSFIAKKWARVLAKKISDIKFREDAFDKLIIDNEVKDLMFSLVDCSNSPDAIIGQDIIDNKGGGSIFLLAGKPGLGKTLSAETVAETLKRPLYMIGVGELGTDPTELENSLVNVLNTAAAWNAVLLLDECDIFMEARQNMDVHRNAMVGVFLRLLEYYPGIMFLTTNRVANIDEAFFSRISLAIQFPDLDVAKRYSIWQNIISLYGNSINIKDIDIDALSRIDINGRQIKNSVRLAVSYANYKKKSVTTRDFISIIENAKKFA